MPWWRGVRPGSTWTWCPRSVGPGRVCPAAWRSCSGTFERSWASGEVPSEKSPLSRGGWGELRAGGVRPPGTWEEAVQPVMVLGGKNVLSWKGDFGKELRHGPGYCFMANGGKSFSTQHRTGLFQAEKGGGGGVCAGKGVKESRGACPWLGTNPDPRWGHARCLVVSSGSSRPRNTIKAVAICVSSPTRGGCPAALASPHVKRDTVSTAQGARALRLRLLPLS